MSGWREPGFWWFRVGRGGLHWADGWGLHWKDTRRHRSLFSDRNKLSPWYARLRVGPWQFGVLRPIKGRSER